MKEEQAPPASDFDRICALADGIRPLLRKRKVVGLSWRERFAEEVSANKGDLTQWYPFTAMSETPGCQFLRLPGESDAQRLLAIRVLRQLEAEVLLLVAKAHALRRRIPTGGILVVADHLNLTGCNPLTGWNDTRIGPRYPDMTQPYHPQWMDRIEQAGLTEGEAIQRCIYAGINSPPTHAEVRWLSYIGADVYGFGMVTDTVAGVHCGLPVAAIVSAVTSQVPEDPPGNKLMENETNAINRRLSQIIKRAVSL